jgi:hypothetical protein
MHVRGRTKTPEADEKLWSQPHIPEDEVESTKYYENSVKKDGAVAVAPPHMDP